MGTPRSAKAQETVIGRFKHTTEVFPNGVTKEIREEKTITLRREPEPGQSPVIPGVGEELELPPT